MNTAVMFSSSTDLCSTPQDFFDKLDAEFNFTLDVCANQENAKCKAFYTLEEDGLKQSWKVAEGCVWMNPPYGRGYENGFRDAADKAIGDIESKEWRNALIDARARKEKAKS